MTWICKICGYEDESGLKPEECPICGEGEDAFEEN